MKEGIYYNAEYDVIYELIYEYKYGGWFTATADGGPYCYFPWGGDYRGEFFVGSKADYIGDL